MARASLSDWQAFAAGAAMGVCLWVALFVAFAVIRVVPESRNPLALGATVVGAGVAWRLGGWFAACGLVAGLVGVSLLLVGFLAWGSRGGSII